VRERERKRERERLTDRRGRFRNGRFQVWRGDLGYIGPQRDGGLDPGDDDGVALEQRLVEPHNNGVTG